MKFKNVKEIYESGVKKIYRVYDEENFDEIGIYSDLRESKKDVKNYIDECDGECDIIAVEMQFNNNDVYLETTKFYYDYGKFIEIK